MATTGSSFGPSSITILVDNTMCIGNETTVTECSYTIFPNISLTCSNNTEAGVMCRDECKGLIINHTCTYIIILCL